jgi:hypothetical protein
MKMKGARIDMERLTTTGYKTIDRIDVTSKMVYEKLAAYEDTGLMPEQITALQEENTQLREKIMKATKLSCDGCDNRGKFENEIEYGYPSPCTICRRKCVDNYQTNGAKHEN